MKSILTNLIKRIISIFITLLVTTMVMYGIMMLTPVETRVELFMPKNLPARLTEEQIENIRQIKIKENHLNDPYPIQYYYWIRNLMRGEWGYSPTLGDGVLESIIRRSPVTAELTLYSILVFIPIGLLSGVIAGSRQNKAADHGFRFTAYFATSLPPVILAMVLLSVFYVNLNWLSPERTSMNTYLLIRSDEFRQITGLLTIDGLLNGRPDVTLDALRHLVMPVFTLTLVHWATLARITRTAIIDVKHQDYVMSARARGIPEKKITWRHMLPNAIAPALASSVLSTASLVTGVFVVEIIYSFHGISEIATKSMQFIPDAAAALGFSIYSVLVVLLLMTILDGIQALLNPRALHGGK
ncbi:ABC transporter permease [bacterium]|nr:ABC transporter permease [bacterium]